MKISINESTQVLNKVENSLAKGKVSSRYKYFLLLTQCFQKLSAADAYLKWERVNFLNTNLE